MRAVIFRTHGFILHKKQQHTDSLDQNDENKQAVAKLNCFSVIDNFNLNHFFIEFLPHNFE